jgi:hypothetical protein
MNLRFLSTACVTCLVWLSMNMSAQSPTPAIRGLITAPHNYVLPAVTGKPYKLTETRTTTKKRAAGPPETTVFVEHRMRDSEGRVRTEKGRIENGNFKCMLISLIDPVGHFTANLYPDQKQAVVTHYLPPKPLTPEEKLKVDAKEAQLAEARKSAPKNPNREDLPAETIDGISVPGRRLHLVMQGVPVIEDTWGSSELGIEMKSETDDPRSGHFSMIVSDLQRTEPLPSLFRIPDDYKVRSLD